jgi:hypothetical protein
MPKRLHLILRTHHGALHMLSKSKGKKMGIILKNTPKITKAIQVLFKYILKNKLNLKQTHLDSLKPHKKFIRKIAHGKIKVAKPIIQKGGSILNTVLNTVLPFLTLLI